MDRVDHADQADLEHPEADPSYSRLRAVILPVAF